MINLRPLTQPAGLEQLLATHPLQPFLQSWAWGEFQASLGRRIWRLGAFEGRELIGATLVVEHQLMMGKNYLYVPRGPVAQNEAALHALIPAIQALGQQAGAIFVKVDPPEYSFPFSLDRLPIPASIGTPLQDPATLVIDLQQSAEQLLSQMHSKTRYNIRLAEKKGVTTRWSTSDEDFTTFMRLQHVMAEHQGIRLHPDEYYRRMFGQLRGQNQVSLVVGEWQGQPLVINEVVWHQTTATYNHGGSSTEHKEVMTPYLVQWATMQEAQRRGMASYDLRGIAPQDVLDHKLAGVTRFKKGFGGRIVIFPPTYNLILQPTWYQAYRLAKRIRGGVDV